MFKLSKLLYLLLLLTAFIVPVANATDNYIPIRVGISDTKFQTYLFDVVSFNKAATLNVLDSATGHMFELPDNSEILKVTSENNLFRIYVDGELIARNLTGPILVNSKIGNYIEITGLKRKGKQAFYRGFIELTRSSKDISKFSIVNVLSLKNYLRGVVPNEMPTRFGLEALKSQTVAARNYAITPRVKAYQEFDVCDSVACQVYFGANTEEELSDKAVEQTNGIIALDRENKPILALYSSTAGGYTESYSYAFSDPKTKEFPSKDIHYLQATPDSEYFPDLSSNEAAENFYMSRPESFDDMSPYYRWSKDWTEDELSKILQKTLVAQSKTGFVYPQLIREEDFGKLISIIPVQRGKSGKIIKLEIKTTKNNFIVEKELVIRRVFQKDGISLPSANFVVYYINSLTPVYKFAGGGFGHGVGLSQWGAGKMASMGYCFDDILQHYYRGIKLSTIPIKIYPDKKVNDRIFYNNHEEGNVYIKSNGLKGNLKITVNGKEHNLKIKNDVEYADISKYLQKGENKISYLFELEKNGIMPYIEAFIIVKGAINDGK